MTFHQIQSKIAHYTVNVLKVWSILNKFLSPPFVFESSQLLPLILDIYMQIVFSPSSIIFEFCNIEHPFIQYLLHIKHSGFTDESVLPLNLRKPMLLTNLIQLTSIFPRGPCSLFLALLPSWSLLFILLLHDSFSISLSVGVFQGPSSALPSQWGIYSHCHTQWIKTWACWPECRFRVQCSYFTAV